MRHYRYFIKPLNALTIDRLNQLVGPSDYDEADNLYLANEAILRTMFNLKKELQGTGGRTSPQPIDFELWRQPGDEAKKQMTLSQIETLLRKKLALKPKYLQAAVPIHKRYS